mmetsp:Transcript_29491/g.71677  ORF Transcript_29491/g.71677 Transcript_29491/m.71677 type:complete len:200 (+) Transcript_29491:870-1469(+)
MCHLKHEDMSRPFEERDILKPRLVGLPGHLALKRGRHRSKQPSLQLCQSNVLRLVEVFSQPTLHLGRNALSTHEAVEVVHRSVEDRRLRVEGSDDTAESTDHLAPQHGSTQHKHGGHQLLNCVPSGGLDVAIPNRRDRHDRPVDGSRIDARGVPTVELVQDDAAGVVNRGLAIAKHTKPSVHPVILHGSLQAPYARHEM